MRIAFFTEGGYRGKILDRNIPMRTDQAWVCALNAFHYPIPEIMTQGCNETYDIGIVIIPKTTGGNTGALKNSFDRDYNGTTQNPVPNLEDVETGGGGLPASPFVPNLTSPGPGSVNAADMPEYAGELPDPQFNVEFGSGKGGLVSPSETSAEIAQQGTLGTYISGRSYQGSDGKA